MDQAVSRASLAQASISTVVPPTTHLPLGHRHTRMSARPFIGYLSRRILSTVQRPVSGTAWGHARRPFRTGTNMVFIVPWRDPHAQIVAGLWQHVMLTARGEEPGIFRTVNLLGCMLPGFVETSSARLHSG